MAGQEHTPIFESKIFIYCPDLEAAKSLNMLKICIISFGSWVLETFYKNIKSTITRDPGTTRITTVHYSSGFCLCPTPRQTQKHQEWFLLLPCQKHNIDSQRRGNILAQIRRNLLPCTVMTKVVQQKICLSIGCYLAQYRVCSWQRGEDLNPKRH